MHKLHAKVYLIFYQPLATGAAIKTETTSATEKMSADNIRVGVGGVQRDQSSVDTTGIVKESFWENFVHCKCETVTILVFSRGSVPAVL